MTTKRLVLVGLLIWVCHPPAPPQVIGAKRPVWRVERLTFKSWEPAGPEKLSVNRLVSAQALPVRARAARVVRIFVFMFFVLCFAWLMG